MNMCIDSYQINCLFPTEKHNISLTNLIKIFNISQSLSSEKIACFLNIAVPPVINELHLYNYAIVINNY
jgi:hypothetical protein